MLAAALHNRALIEIKFFETMTVSVHGVIVASAMKAGSTSKAHLWQQKTSAFQCAVGLSSPQKEHL
jgi:hypothetical protein